MSDLYIPNDKTIFLKPLNPHNHLTQTLATLVHKFPPKDVWTEAHGLHLGPTAVAYLFLHLSRTHPKLLVEEKSPQEWCTAYLAGVRPPPEVLPRQCGIVNEELAFCAVSAAATQDSTYINRFLKYIPAITKTNTTHRATTGDCNDPCDHWGYGKAGTLYMLRLIRAWVPSSSDLLHAPTTQLIDCILANGPPWVWANGEYLGAGQGAMGIMTQIILTSPSHAPALEPKLSLLLDLQTPAGNWPVVLPAIDGIQPKVHDDLVQFCHGAPGFVISLPKLRPYFSPALQERIDDTIERGRAYTWEKGLTRKMPNLCHGITGNALAFDGARRDHFLAHATEEYIRTAREEGVFKGGDERLYGLGDGLAGRVWGWMVADLDREMGYIGYNDI
ncbi:hypothetical protein MMC12_001474 [Toensbergia leucococca]|nr:hypothetical protein [Toensbergia leucococca]